MTYIQAVVGMRRTVCMLVCLHAFVYYTRMHTCIHAYIHTCIHTYIHKCSHTQKLTNIHNCTHTKKLKPINKFDHSTALPVLARHERMPKLWCPATGRARACHGLHGLRLSARAVVKTGAKFRGTFTLNVCSLFRK